MTEVEITWWTISNNTDAPGANEEVTVEAVWGSMAFLAAIDAADKWGSSRIIAPDGRTYTLIKTAKEEKA